MMHPVRKPHKMILDNMNRNYGKWTRIAVKQHQCSWHNRGVNDVPEYANNLLSSAPCITQHHANYAFMNRYSCLKTTTDNLLYFSLKYCIYKHVILAYLFNPSKFSITVYIYKYWIFWTDFHMDISRTQYAHIKIAMFMLRFSQ